MNVSECKISLKCPRIAWILLCLCGFVKAFAVESVPDLNGLLPIRQPLTDTTPASVPIRKTTDKSQLTSVRPDTLPAKPDSSSKRQRIDTLDIRLSPDSLDAPVNYQAEDSMVLEVDTKRIMLYGKTKVDYTDVSLTAPSLVFDQASQVVTASMARDTAGKVTGMAKLVQGETTTVSDSIRFNFKTQKGLTYASFFQQSEIYNFAEKVKKVDPETFYASRGRFTTCNLDTPHFAFRFRKAKFVNKKVAVTGPVYPEFEGVPVPVFLPFAIFPLATGRRSGFIPPQFTVTEDFGIGLEGIGYYKVISDYLDAKVWADIYSYGSWRANFSPSYRRRYRYNGNFNISLQNTKFAFKGDPDFRQTRSFFVTWNHSMDGKARPGTNFSASVQAGSSKYPSLVPNGALVNAGTVGGVGGSYMQPVNFTNQLTSTISYQKSWQGRPFNLTVNLNHNQNTNTRLVNLNLPDVAFVMNTVYPFQPREMVGDGKWYQKLGIGYNGNVRGQVSFYDTAFQFKKLIDTFQWGAVHEIPVILSLPSLGPIQVAPNFSFRERWYAQKMYREWNAATEKLDTTVQKGFFAAREMSVGIAFNTAFFGTFQSRDKDARVQAIRHVMRPQFSLNYKPDLMEPYYARVRVDKAGNERLLSVFDGSLFGAFGPGRSGGIGFGIDNNLEMKLKSKTDTTEQGIRKVKLIDGFGISGGYNFLADSFKLSTFNIYARSNLFEKINVTLTGLLDPYEVNPLTGGPIDRYVWQDGNFKLGSLVNGSLNVSTTLQSKKKDEKKKSNEELLREAGGETLTPDQMMQQLDYVRRNPGEFTDFNIPWSLNLGFNMSFARVMQPDYTFKKEFTSSFNFSGDFNITPKWKMGANGFYDLKTMRLASLTTFVSRDLHCWQMSINVTPVGLYRFFNMSISPKSGMLRDLRINRTRYFYSN